MKKLGEVLEGLFNEEPEVNPANVLRSFFNSIKSRYDKFELVPVANKDVLDEFEKIMNDLKSDTNINWRKITKSVVGFRYKVYSPVINYSYEQVGVFCYGNEHIILIKIQPSQGVLKLQLCPGTIGKKKIHGIFNKNVEDHNEIIDSQFWILPITPEEFEGVWSGIKYH